MTTVSDDLSGQSVMNALWEDCRPGITMQQEPALCQLISGERKLSGRFFGLGLRVSFVCDV